MLIAYRAVNIREQPVDAAYIIIIDKIDNIMM